MHFLNPQAFWAFFLLLIPIFIHLFNFRRVKKIYFSNLSFLTNIRQEQKSQSTLKRILILITRLFAIIFIVFAFSRPVLLSDADQEPVKSPVIYIDNSLSMQRTDPGGTTLLTNALAGAENLLNGPLQGTKVGLITNDQSVLRWEENEKILDRVVNIGFSKQTVSFKSVFERANLLQPADFMLFSDFQKSVALPFEEVLADTAKRITLYYQHSPADRNLFVDSVYLEKPREISGGNVLHIIVKNTGSEAVNDALIKVFRQNEQLSSFSINIEENATEDASVEIRISEELAGDYRIEMEDSPIVFDNIYYFSISAWEKPIVMILYERNPNEYLQNVFANSSYFTLISNSTDNVSFQDILKADLLVLDHLESIPQWLLNQANEISGNILVIPGSDINQNDYASVLGFPVAPDESIQKAPLSSGSIANNPFFEGIFLKKSDRMSLPDVRVSYRPGGFYHTLLETRAKDPFLVQSGDRNAFLLTTPLNDSTTNFPKHALFVPVMYKMVQQEKSERLSYRLDERLIAISGDSIDSQSILRLSKGQNLYVIPSGFRGGELVFEIPEVLNAPGIYVLMSGEDTLRSIAFNYNKLESEIETIAPDEIRKMISGYDHIRLEEITDMHDFLDNENSKSQNDGLWKYALILALIFIVSELLLLRFI